jgi:hypothetical protein
MKKKVFTAVFLLLCSVHISYAQLFTLISDAQANLTQSEQAKLDEFRLKEGFESINMIQVGNIFNVQSNGILPVFIPGHTGMNAKLYRLEVSSPDNNPDEYVWEGSFFETVLNDVNEEVTEEDGSIRLMKKDGEIYGFIYPYNSNEVWEVASLGPGKSALIKYEEGFYATENECSAVAEEETEHEKVTGPCNNTVRVLVLYTNTGKALTFNNLHNVINLAINDLNGGVYNSGKSADATFVLAGTQELLPHQYSELPLNAEQSRKNLRSNPTAQYWRNIYAADVVICLVGLNTLVTPFWGDSDIGVGNSNEAYGVVSADKTNGFYTFSHEVGHIMGGRHQTTDIYNDGADDHAGSMHGYNWYRGWPHNKRYYDIMHKLLTGHPRQHLFSTPDKEIFGRDMGIANKCNAAQTIADNACTVAAYRGDTYVPFRITLSGPSSATNNQTINLTATPFDGVPTYSFDWWYTSNGGANWYHLANTSATSTYQPSTTTYTMPATPGSMIWVKGTTAANETSVAVKTIQNASFWLNPGNCCNYPMKPGRTEDTVAHIVAGQEKTIKLSVNPNPLTSDNGLFINTNLVAEHMNGGEAIIITDVTGRKVWEQKMNKMPNMDINNINLSSGTYFVRLTGILRPIIQTLVITK